MRSWANLVGGDKEEKGLPHADGNGLSRLDAEGYGRALTKAQASAAPGRCTAFAVRTPAHARARFVAFRFLSSIRHINLITLSLIH